MAPGQSERYRLLDESERRLLWRCRRGMKELDLLLESYVRGQYARASAGDRQAFERLLALPDPELALCLLGPGSPRDRDLADIVRRVRDAT
jgi:antitoxin CptB